MALCVGFDEDIVHSIYPEASMCEAQKIWSLPDSKKYMLKECCDSGNYLASLKIDGYFYQLNKTPNYTYLFSKSTGVNGLLTEKSKNVPHIVRACDALPADTVLIGEIYVPKGTSKDVTKIMGCNPDKAIQRQKVQGNIQYYLNDIIQLDGEDLTKLPFKTRIDLLERIYSKYFSSVSDIICAHNIEYNIYDIALEYLKEGQEGMVLKKKDSPYICGKRPAWSSIKIKQVDGFDAIITGFCEPTKEYTGKELSTWTYFDNGMPVTKAYSKGWVGAIKIGAYDENGGIRDIGTVSSGLTDELKEDFATHPDKYLNKVVEIQCMSKDKENYTLRHGFLKRIRDDKSAKDCTINEIFDK